jgi:hypothetical protein
MSAIWLRLGGRRLLERGLRVESVAWLRGNRARGGSPGSGRRLPHVLVPDPGRQWTDADQFRVEVVEIDLCVPVDAGLARPVHDLPGLRVDQPDVLVIGLIRQCVTDLSQVEGVQI